MPRLQMIIFDLQALGKNGMIATADPLATLAGRFENKWLCSGLVVLPALTYK